MLPTDAVAAVRELVGPENTAAFIAAAARREVQARALDSLVTSVPPHPHDAGPGGAAAAPGPDGTGSSGETRGTIGG